MAGSSLDALGRPGRAALRALLLRATAVAGNPVTDADRAGLATLVERAPIDALADAAALHRVSGSVLRGLDGVTGVPDRVRAALTRQRDAAAMRQLLIVGALSALGRRFDDAGVRWVVMKGPVVAGLLYPDVGDRSYGDLDLLVLRQDFATAADILEQLGYVHTTKDWALAERMLAGELGMISALATVDLHWHLHYSTEDRQPFELPIEAMLARARRVTVSGIEVPTLDPVDTLLTLAFHAARSDGHRLVWFKDVERSLVVERPDLDELVRRARASQVAGAVGLILGRARSLLGAPVPVEILRELVPASLRTVEIVTTRAVDTVQFHERPTVTRLMTRSVRTSLWGSAREIPERAVRATRRRIFPAELSGTDDAGEKASYLAAVAGSGRR